jgi:collagenase-like PrtC family protease
MLEKATAIATGKEYDTRVKISLEFSNEELLEYMMMAHEMDVTFNEFVTQALESAIAQHAKPRDSE